MTMYRVKFDLYLPEGARLNSVTFEYLAKDQYEARSMASVLLRQLNLQVRDIIVEWD
jgi:hypothetical protein